MTAIRYSGLNFDDPDEQRRIAKLHMEMPSSWLEHFEVSDEDLENVYQGLRKSADAPDLHVIVASQLKRLGEMWMKEQGPNALRPMCFM